MPEACYVAVDVTAVLVPGFAGFSTEFVLPFCISRQIISSDTENFLVSLNPSGDLILCCTPPEPQVKPAARYGSTFLIFSGLKTNRFIHISEAFLTTVEEETCPMPKFYKVPCR